MSVLSQLEVVNDDLVASDDELTLDLDPDNEFLWSDAAVAKVQQQFRSWWSLLDRANSATTPCAASGRIWKGSSVSCCKAES